jgi:hypothetical protein
MVWQCSRGGTVTFGNYSNNAPVAAFTADDLAQAVERIKAVKGSVPLELSFHWRSGLVESEALAFHRTINDYPDAGSRSAYFPRVSYPPKARRLSQCLCVTSLSSAVGLPQCWRDQASEWNVNRCGAVEVEVDGVWHVYVPRGRSR